MVTASWGGGTETMGYLSYAVFKLFVPLNPQRTCRRVLEVSQSVGFPKLRPSSVA